MCNTELYSMAVQRRTQTSYVLWMYQANIQRRQWWK